MALTKKTYVDGETKITAENLNAIQDAIVDLENKSSGSSNKYYHHQVTLKGGTTSDSSGNNLILNIFTTDSSAYTTVSTAINALARAIAVYQATNVFAYAARYVYAQRMGAYEVEVAFYQYTTDVQLKVRRWTGSSTSTITDTVTEVTFEQCFGG